MRTHHSGSWARRGATAGVALTLLASLTASPAGGAPGDCPSIMPVADVRAGMMGTGLTVSKGTTPDEFDAEILGVYPDAILPGRDLVIAEVHSPAIDQVGGVWAGMSGSPVYVTDGGEEKLVGAVAWSFSFGPSHVIGLTAAEDMAAILDYASGSAAAQRALPSKVRLTSSMKRTVARATGRSSEEMADSFTRLKTPVSVSGGSTRALQRLQKMMNRRGFAVHLYSGASASAEAAADASDIQPGGNFAAAFSYGDITYAGIGTTTFICDGFAVAFGHPFSFEGKTTLGANAANALTVVPDPVFGGFKLATVEGNVGTVDQDRFAGIRADLGQPLTTIPIDSTTIAQNTGRTDEGHTDAVVSEVVPFISWYHEYLGVISAMDQYSEGSGEIRWTVTGTRADGSPWEVHRSNLASSTYDLPFEITHEYLHMIDRLYYQGYEDIEFTGVDFEEVTVRDTVKQYKISKVLVSVDGSRFEKTRRIRVHPGDRIDLRAILNPYDEGLDQEIRTLSVRVPRDAHKSGEIRVFGGSGHHPGIVGKATSFDDLLDKMANEATNDRLGVNLRLGRRIKADDATTLDQVVAGGRSISVRLPGGRRGVKGEGSPVQ